MSSIYQYVKDIKDHLDQHGIIRELSLKTSHVLGLASIVLQRKPDGGLIRVFIAEYGLAIGDIQFHTHKYGLTLTPLTLGVVHHSAVLCRRTEVDAVQLTPFQYGSVIQSEAGQGCLAAGEPVHLALSQYPLPIGSQIRLKASDIHTVSGVVDSIWIVEEHPESRHKLTNTVFGVPFDPVETDRVNDQHVNYYTTILKDAFNEYLEPWNVLLKDKNHEL